MRCPDRRRYRCRSGVRGDRCPHPPAYPPKIPPTVTSPLRTVVYEGPRGLLDVPPLSCPEVGLGEDPNTSLGWTGTSPESGGRATIVPEVSPSGPVGRVGGPVDPFVARPAPTSIPRPDPRLGGGGVPEESGDVGRRPESPEWSETTSGSVGEGSIMTGIHSQRTRTLTKSRRSPGTTGRPEG